MAVNKGGVALDALWERVSNTFDVWIERLQMQWCEIAVMRNDSRSNDDEGTAAETLALWQYRSATIEVYLTAIAHYDDPDITRMVVHELVHILINPMESLCSEAQTQECELAVENVARAIMDAYASPRV